MQGVAMLFNKGVIQTHFLFCEGQANEKPLKRKTKHFLEIPLS